MSVQRTILEEFKENYPWIAAKGIRRHENIDDDRILMTLDTGQTYIYDSTRSMHKLIAVSVFDDSRELNSYDWYKEFGYLLEIQMKIKHMTAKELSDHTGIKPEMISKYLNATARPSAREMFEIVYALDCDFSDLEPTGIVPI